MSTTLACNYPGVSSLAHSDFTRLLVHWFLEPNLHHKMARLKSELTPDPVTCICTCRWCQPSLCPLIVTIIGRYLLSWQWHCSHNGVLYGNQVECLHWAGHCITLARSVPLFRTWFLCTLSTCTLYTVYSHRLPCARLFWHYHCPRVSSHYLIALHFVLIILFLGCLEETKKKRDFSRICSNNVNYVS